MEGCTLAVVRASAPATLALATQERLLTRLSRKAQEQNKMLHATVTTFNNLFMVRIPIVFIGAKIHKILELHIVSCEK